MKGEVVALVSMDEYKSCRNCNAKVVEGGKFAMGECSKCNTKMKMSKCNKQCIAHVIIEDDKGKEHKVTVFSDVLKQIAYYGKEAAGVEADISKQVLSAPSLNYTITKKDIVKPGARRPVAGARLVSRNHFDADVGMCVYVCVCVCVCVCPPPRLLETSGVICGVM